MSACKHKKCSIFLFIQGRTCRTNVETFGEKFFYLGLCYPDKVNR